MCRLGLSEAQGINLLPASMSVPIAPTAKTTQTNLVVTQSFVGISSSLPLIKDMSSAPGGFDQEFCDFLAQNNSHNAKNV
jgi:hypothetical protein